MTALLVRAGALGDLLLLRRAVAHLRCAGERVDLLAPPAARLLEGNGPAAIERVLPWEGPETALLLADETAAGPVSSAIREASLVLAFTRSEPLSRALAREARRLVVHDPSPPPGKHAARWLGAPLPALGVADSGDPPPLAFSVNEHRQAEAWAPQLPRGFLAIHPGSGSLAKNWPAERFAALAGRLASDRPWLLILGPADDPGPWSARNGAVVVREPSLRLLGALLSRAGLYVGNDSGISHLAAACGAPTLALFGPTDPRQWAPDGPRVACVWTGSLETLDLEPVVSAARNLAAGAQVSGERTSILLINR